jgi:cytoskeletal protein RodZ
VSIGNSLVEARRHSGLTITEVSQRTCIRETIIRGIERSDFSGCGGDFYARGHIRSIAGAVGAEPEPLIREYDATQGAPEAISAAEVFQPATPIKMRERRRPNWTAAMTLALLVIAGIFTYQHFASRSATTSALATGHVEQTRPRLVLPKVAKHRITPHRPRRLDIRLTAKQDCWVQLTTAAGQSIFSGTVYAGSTMNWIERKPVSMVIGNPTGVTVRVNGKDPVPAGSVSTVTLSLHAGLEKHRPAGG